MPPLLSRTMPEPARLAFPFRVEGGGPALAKRAQHVHGIVEQVLFTAPGERVFRDGFGAGALQLVFEPVSELLARTVEGRLAASLADALQGEVDPKSLRVALDVSGAEAGQLVIAVEYELAAVRLREVHAFTLGSGPGGSGG